MAVYNFRQQELRGSENAYDLANVAIEERFLERIFQKKGLLEIRPLKTRSIGSKSLDEQSDEILDALMYGVTET